LSVFVDTSALYALLVRTEADHEAAVRTLDRLVKAKRPLLTSNYVVLETAAVLQHRLGLAPVRDLETHLVPLCRLAWVSEEMHGRALQRLFRTNRRELSLVDCSSFEIMDADGIRDAFAFDTDFETEGYRVVRP
jgi:predicted nucleic acid-binding protein